MLITKPVSEVKEIIRYTFGKVRMDSETVALLDCLGRVLAEDVNASAYIPDFDRSTRDGYAVRANDLLGCSESSPVRLKLVGHSKMGEHTEFHIEKGQCAYVPTGGEVPAGTDAVAMIEDTRDLEDGWIAFKKPYLKDENLIFRGEDMKPGDVVIPAGKRLKIADTGTLTAMGIVNVPVMKKPMVGIISTGDELVPAGESLKQVGMIRDINTPMLHHALHACGCTPIHFGIVKDDKQDIITAIRQAISQCDLLIVSGGTSMDEKDMLTAIIEELGEVILHGITVKPGKPTILGTIQGKPVFGMPGNPVSAYFTFHTFIRPLLYSFQGTGVVDRKITLPLLCDFISTDSREEYVPVLLKDGFVDPVIIKSGLITTVSCADGYMVVPRNCLEVKKGTPVEVTFLDE